MSATFHTSTRSTPATSSPTSDCEIIEQLKRQLGATEQRLQYAELKIRVLEERLRQQRIAKYGPGSEKLCDEQLELLELEPGVSGAEVEAESQRESLPSSRKPRRKHPGRQTLPENLPRVEKIVVCTPEQLWLAKILYIRRINDLRDRLHSTNSVKILSCLCAFDVCSAGSSPSFAPEKNSSWRTLPFGNNCWLCTQSDLVLD